MSLTTAKSWDDVEKAWQKETKKWNLELVKKIDKSFDEKLLVEDYKSVISKFKTTSHSHGSPWKGVGLISSNGKPEDIMLMPGTYKETPALECAPYIKSILDSIQAEKKRVRLMELSPGFTLDWHVDGVQTNGNFITRYHIPVITNDNVLSQVSHVDYFFKPGEFWFMDTSFPHRTGNFGSEVRTHLLIELVLDNYVKEMIGIDLTDKDRRAKSSLCSSMLYKRI